MILNNILQSKMNKHFIQKEVQYLCNELKIPLAHIRYDNLKSVNALAESHTNTIVFNTNLINGVNVHKNYDNKENQLFLKSLIAHEVEHLRQYQENIDTINTPAGLGENHIVVDNKTEYPFNKMSLYIKGNYNKFLYSVYVLQPNEYNAFQKGATVLRESSQKIKTNRFVKQLYAIENAVSFIKQYFDVDDPVQEISNALMNLYDDGERECSDGIQDLVTRCAICSYEDENDYGIDKVSLLLGENYVKTLENNKIKQEEKER